MLSTRRKIILLIILVVLLAMQGCAGQVAVTSFPAISTATSTSLRATTETPSPQPSATNTATPDAVATTNSMETASIGTLVATVSPTVIEKHPSSDGKWRAEIIRYDCSYVNNNYNQKIAYEQMKLLNLDDGTEKIVADQEQYCEGVGAFGLHGLYWSPNNRYFYFNESREGYPDGGCGNYIPQIYRLDPANQEVLTLEGGFISPDKTKLALWQGREIVIWDLNIGEIERVASLNPELLAGRIWWSKTGNSILYLQTDSQCIPDFGKFNLVSLDLTSLSQNSIAQYEFTNTGNVSTPAPAGVFVFYFYAPLIMNYEPSLWEIHDGVLQAKDLTSCTIAEQGPTDFNGPHSKRIKQLGKIDYTILSFPDSPADQVRLLYMADQTLATDSGLPIYLLSANPSEWDRCQSLAEEVLSTLHFPFP